MPILFHRFRQILRRERGDGNRAPRGTVLSLGCWLPVDSVPIGGGPPRQIPPEWRRIPRRLWQYQPRPRRILLGRPPESAPELGLLLNVEESEIGRHRVLASAPPSVIIHVLAALWLLSQSIGPSVSTEEMELALRFRSSTPLVAPPPELIRELTGGAPGVREMTLEGLLAEPSAVPAVEQAPSPRPYIPPAAPAAPPTPAPVIEAPEPPVIEPPTNVPADATPPGLGAPALAPPPDEPPREETPKLAFETPGPATFSRSRRASSGRTASAPAAGSIPQPPASSVDAAIEEVARNRGSGPGAVIGDQNLGGVSEARTLPPPRKGAASNIQMLNDPKGVDFRPYLIQVLAAVRRNWQSVMPESARLGLRGKVVIQFAINQTGSVPKLVIANPSGSDPLDRAAVAAISASNPFQRLPANFTGDEIRLQLNFRYNMR